MLSIIEKVLLLQDVDILKTVSTEHLGYLAQLTDETEFDEGDTIYQEGDPADALYVVISGEVRIHHADKNILIANTNNAFGVWALFDEDERLVSATCTSFCRLLCLTKNNFHDVLADHSDISSSILRAMAKRLRSLIGRVSLSGSNQRE